MYKYCRFCGKKLVNKLEMRCRYCGRDLSYSEPVNSNIPVSVVWRDNNGKIRCLGDACLQKQCDDTCPIWCNTVGTKLLQMGQYEKAIEGYKQGIKIADDFPDLWNNLAVCYGNLKKYQEAYNAYKKAYELAGKKNALYGLALSARDCGNKEEALIYCREYRRKFEDGALDNVEKALSEETNESEHSSLYLDMLVELLNNGNQEGYVDYQGTIVNIPELGAQADKVCSQLFKAVSDVMDENNNHSKDVLKKLEVVSIWCAFAGMGAVWYWNEDWNKLKVKGIVETLSKPEGINYMDDVVLDVIGIGRNSEEASKFRQYFQTVSLYILSKFPEVAKGDSEKVMNGMMERNKAMYLYGVTIEMNRLGMK